VDDLALWESTTLNVGMNERDTEDLRLLGVPAQHTLEVVADLSDEVRLSVTDAMGRACQVRILARTSSGCIVDVAHLANGTYVLLLEGSRPSQAARFTVLR
jgi:hypothetical protein